MTPFIGIETMKTLGFKSLHKVFKSLHKVFKSLHKVFKRDKIVCFGNEIFDEIIRFTGTVGTN